MTDYDPHPTEAESLRSELAARNDEIARLKAELAEAIRLRDEHFAENVRAQASVAAAEHLVADEAKVFRCFHCGFETADHAEAEAHFGERDDPQECTPTCRWWARMSKEERVAEFQANIKELNGEREHSAKLRERIEDLEYQVNGIEAAVSSRFPGCKSINDAFNLYDSTKGELLAAKAELAEVAKKLKEWQDWADPIAMGLEPIEGGGVWSTHDCREFIGKSVAQLSTATAELATAKKRAEAAEAHLSKAAEDWSKWAKPMLIKEYGWVPFVKKVVEHVDAALTVSPVKEQI